MSRGWLVVAAGLVSLVSRAQEGTCAKSADCAPGFVCEGFRELAPGQWSRGQCMARLTPASCAEDKECQKEERCVGFRKLDDRTWTRGVCEARTQHRPGDPPVAAVSKRGDQRFEYQGSVPPGFELHERANGLALGIGGGLFAAGTGISIFWWSLLRDPLALVPVAGASIAVYSRPGVTGHGLAVVGGIAQAAGISLFIVGLLTPRRWLERSAVTLVPTPQGVAVSGSF